MASQGRGKNVAASGTSVGLFSQPERLRGSEVREGNRGLIGRPWSPAICSGRNPQRRQPTGPDAKRRIRSELPHEQGGAECAAEVADAATLKAGGGSDRRGSLHVLLDLRAERLAEADAEAAAEDHHLGVEQVDGGGDPGAQRLDGPVDQLLGHLVVVLERRCQIPLVSRGLSCFHQLE